MMYNSETTDAAIVLLGHGSIRESANVEIRGLWKLIMEQMPEYHIQGAFVEVAEPLLDDVIGKLAEAGVEKVVIVPLFLTRGHHMLNGAHSPSWVGSADCGNCKEPYPGSIRVNKSGL